MKLKQNFYYFFVAILLAQAACVSNTRLPDGPTAVAQKQYAVAIPMLQKEFKKAKSRVLQGKTAWFLGEAYYGINDWDNAAEWYKKAYDYQYGAEALRAAAFSLKAGGKYEDAKEAFKNLGFEIGSPYEYRKEILSCDIAQQWTKTPEVGYTLTALPFNSSANDYHPVLLDQNALLFSSDRSTSTGEKKYGWTGENFSDIYTAKVDANAASSWSDVINTKDNEGSLVLHPSGKYGVFVRCQGSKGQTQYCQLFMTTFDNGNWTAPTMLPFVQNNVNYGSPCWDEKGLGIYFAADDPTGWGGYDIYYAPMQKNDWGGAQLMSRSINSTADDMWPSVDNDTLYFASRGHSGMGGLDVFKSVRLKNGSWLPPINLQAPLNSSADDFGYVIDRRTPWAKGTLSKGFLSSNRKGGQGGDDIYAFEKVFVPQPPPPPVVELPQAKYFLDVYVVTRVFKDPNNPNSLVLGRKPLEEAELITSLEGKGSETKIIDNKGFYRIALAANTDYQFKASKKAYLTNSGKFSTKGMSMNATGEDRVFELEIILDKIFLNQEIRLENIYYDFDKWDIREDAKPTLNALAQNLQLNPDLYIRLSSHTDCRGNDRYNEELSQRRAQSAVEYLISKGVDAGRLTAKGFGESVPADDCLCNRCTEEEHQVNRRTAFTILE